MSNDFIRLYKSNVRKYRNFINRSINHSILYCSNDMMMAMDFNRSENLELSLYSQGFRSTEKDYTNE
jgi:hypothetical protein